MNYWIIADVDIHFVVERLFSESFDDLQHSCFFHVFLGIGSGADEIFSLVD